MIAGQVAYPVVRIVDSVGAGVTGLTTSDVAVAAYVNATTPVASFTVTELGLGYYRLALTTSGTAGWHQYRFTSTARTVIPSALAGWLGTQDADTLFAVVVKPVASVSNAGVVASALNLEMIAKRYTPVAIAVTNQNGAAFDLSGYNNYRFTVWDALHSGGTFLYQLTTGITGDAAGALAFNVPEGAAFWTQVDTAIAAGRDSVDLYYDVVADAAATAAQSRTIIRGKLTVHRYEASA